MRFAAAVFCLVLVAASCTDGQASTGGDRSGPMSTVPMSAVPVDTATVLAVADLTDCRGPDAEVAALVRSLDGTILMPGDLAYDVGSVEDFRTCFLPAYGSELDRTRAVPGDNDYETPGAEPYFDTMGGRAGDPGAGWYAAEIGSWQIIARAIGAACTERRSVP